MKTDVTTVSNLVLDRYLGRWYEIARIDNRFERGISNAFAEYSLNPNGTIKVVNSC
jgi:lipocalin